MNSNNQIYYAEVGKTFPGVGKTYAEVGKIYAEVGKKKSAIIPSVSRLFKNRKK